MRRVIRAPRPVFTFEISSHQRLFTALARTNHSLSLSGRNESAPMSLLALQISEDRLVRSRVDENDKPSVVKRGEGEGSEEICATVEIRGVCRLRRGAKKQRDSFVCKCFLVAVAASTDVSYLLSDKMWLARKRRAYTGSTGHAIKRANLPCILRRSCLNFH